MLSCTLPLITSGGEEDVDVVGVGAAKVDVAFTLGLITGVPAVEEAAPVVEEVSVKAGETEALTITVAVAPVVVEAASLPVVVKAKGEV